MTKELKKALSGLISLVLLYFSFKAYQAYFSDLWWMFFVLILFSVTLPTYLLSFIPTTGNKNKGQSKPKSTSKKVKQTKVEPYKTKKEHNLLRSENEILTLPLNELTWREFERLCYLYYKAKGYKPAETSEGADGGVDLVIYNKHHQSNVAIQIKHYKTGNQITVKEIRELNSAKRNHNCMLAEFITTSSFTNEAILQADKFKIECHGIEWVENKILRWRDQEVRKRKISS